MTIAKNITKVLNLFVMLVLFIAIQVRSTDAQQQKLGEYEVKAAFMYNFMKFIEWPDNAFPDNHVTMNLCILGKDSFGSTLDSAVQGETINNKKIVIKRLNDTHSLEKCHVLFISGSEQEHLTQILKTLNGLNILTVGDTKGFAQQGVVINFYIEENKVRFEINQDAVNRSRLKISSRLLNLAKIVHDESK
jgi:hypothetical protein